MEWTRRNVILAAVLLVTALIPGGVIYVRSEGGLSFVMFRLEKWADGLDGHGTPMTPEEKKIAKREAERVRNAIFVKYPDLRLKGKNVNPEQNGYLGIFDLAGDPRLTELRKARLSDHLSEKKINLSKVRRELETLEELGTDIERVAAMPERSNVIGGRVHSELLPAAEVKAMNDYLLLRARLSALDGDEAESFRLVELAANFTEHLGPIEGPNLLSETLRILQRRAIYQMCLERILPALGESADLEKWNSVLRPHTAVPRRIAKLHKGEFNYFSEKFHLILEEVPDPEQTATAYARAAEASTKHYGEMTFAQFDVASPPSLETITKNLSREGAALIETLNPAFRAWHLGFRQGVILEHQYAAALDLLVLEQSGEDISRRTKTSLTNPYTGRPFGYDPATRTLDAVSETDGADLEALKLPW